MAYTMRHPLYELLVANEIRLAELRPGKWSDEIHLSLFKYNLKKAPKYKALSYVWGFQHNPSRVYINGLEHLSTANLENALRRLRHTDSPMWLWIDAICINQKDTTERSSQVQLMRDIFEVCEEAIVFLGEVRDPDFATSLGSVAAKTSPKVTSTTTFRFDESDMAMIEQLKRNLALRRKSAAIDYGLDVFSLIRLLADGSQHLPFHFQQPGFNEKYSQNLFEAVRLMVHHCPWWSRVWVIQEVVVPNKVTMRYGSLAAPWDMFVKAAHAHRNAPQPLPVEYNKVLDDFSRRILDFEHTRREWRAGARSMGLLQLLRQFGGRRASDKRDTVYALLGLETQRLVQPNYASTDTEVFQNTTLAIIRETTRLDAFAGDLGSKYTPNLPSWTSDWSTMYEHADRIRFENSRHYSASGGCVVYVQDARLEWHGVEKYVQHALEEYNDANKTDLSYEDAETYEKVYGDKWDPCLDHLKPERVREKPLEAMETFLILNSSAACLRSYGNGLLSIPGMRIDTICAMGEARFTEPDHMSIVRSWYDLARARFRPGEYPGDTNKQSFGELFCRTICTDVLRFAGGSRRIQDSDIDALDEWYAALGQWDVAEERAISSRTLSPDRSSDVREQIDAAVRISTSRRRFFVTEQGYMGLGPVKTRVGDGVYLMLGASTPYILREGGSRQIGSDIELSDPAAASRVDLELIGDCYAQGLMYGEALPKWSATVRSAINNTVLNQLAARTRRSANLTRLRREWQDARGELMVAQKAWRNGAKEWSHAIKAWTRDLQERRHKIPQRFSYFEVKRWLQVANDMLLILEAAENPSYSELYEAQEAARAALATWRLPPNYGCILGQQEADLTAEKDPGTQLTHDSRLEALKTGAYKREQAEERLEAVGNKWMAREETSWAGLEISWDNETITALSRRRKVAVGRLHPARDVVRSQFERDMSAAVESAKVDLRNAEEKAIQAEKEVSKPSLWDKPPDGGETVTAQRRTAIGHWRKSLLEWDQAARGLNDLHFWWKTMPATQESMSAEKDLLEAEASLMAAETQLRKSESAASSLGKETSNAEKDANSTAGVPRQQGLDLYLV